MGRVPTVGINDDLPASEPGVCGRAALDELARRVHVQVVAFDLQVRQVALGFLKHRLDDVLLQGLCQILRADPRAMLRGDDDGGNPERVAALVILHCHLGLAIREDVFDDTLLPAFRQQVCHLIGQSDRERHEVRCLLAGIAEHHPLVSRSTDLVVGPHGDVRALFVDSHHDCAGVPIEAGLRAVVPDFFQGAPGDTREVDEVLSGDLAHHHHHAGGAADLAGYTAVRVVCHDLVENCVRDPVAHLIGMPLGDGLGCEQILAHFITSVVLWISCTPRLIQNFYATRYYR